MEKNKVKAEITQLLFEAGEGNQEAANELYPKIYDQLRDIALMQIRREREDLTLGKTDLVHESFLKLIDQKAVQWNDRNHFYAIAARAMRQLLIDHARKKLAEKRGAGNQVLSLDEKTVSVEKQAEELVKLDEALEELKQLNPRLARVVDLRFFCGFNIDEISRILDTSTSTVKRDWAKARAWLYQRMTKDAGVNLNGSKLHASKE